jgi:uncharacterized FlaG/YvyC family protein
VVIEEENEDDISLTIPDTPNEFSGKVIELETENQSLKDKIVSIESELIEKSKASTNDDLEKMISNINTLTFEKNELELKLHDSLEEVKLLR